MKKRMCLLVCAMLAAMVLAGCGDQTPGQETTGTEIVSTPAEPTGASITEPSEEVTQPTTEAETSDPQQPQSGVLENPVGPSECFDIETPYGMLKYPLKWSSHVAIEQQERQDVFVVSFYGVLEGKENHHLFDVIFGGEEGDYIGQILSGTTAVPVFFHTYSVYENETLTADESEMLLAMMEDINEVFNSLLAMDNFQ